MNLICPGSVRPARLIKVSSEMTRSQLLASLTGRWGGDMQELSGDMMTGQDSCGDNR